MLTEIYHVQKELLRHFGGKELSDLAHVQNGEFIITDVNGKQANVSIRGGRIWYMPEDFDESIAVTIEPEQTISDNSFAEGSLTSELLEQDVLEGVRSCFDWAVKV